MSDTPETDANEIIQSFMDLPPSRTGRVKVDFARKLERQRDTLKEALEKILDYQGRFAEEDPESIAAEALQSLNPDHSVAANDMIVDMKGGNHES